MAYCSVDFYQINVRIGLLNIVIFIDMKDIILKVLREVIEQQELGEKTRTLKNARRVTLYPKSAKKANPLRFRPEIREDSTDYGNNLSPEKLDYIKKIIDSSDRINWSELKYVGIDWHKNHRQIYRLLSKKIGSREDIIKKVDDILLNKIHTIDDCGTYNFNFIVYNYDLEQDTDGVYYINEVDCIIDQSGTVTLINLSDEPISFEKLNDDPDNEYESILWELGYEIQDCIKDELGDILTQYTGVEVEDVDIRPGKKEDFE